MTHSYWDTTTTGRSDGVGSSSGTIDVTGLTTSEMKGSTAQSNMGALDFTNTWAVLDTSSAISYPYLQANTQQPEPGRESIGGGGDDGDTGGSDAGAGSATEEQVETTVEASTQETEGGETATATIPDPQEGETVTVDTDTSSDDGAVTLDSVDIEFGEDTDSASVSVSTRSADNPPAGAPDPDSGQTGDPVGYIETTTDASTDAIDQSTFNFEVADQRLEQTDTSPEDVVLYRVVDGEPTPLETDHLGGNSFRAFTPGYSVFVIGTTGANISVVSGALDATTVDPGEAVTATVEVRNDGGSAGEVDLTLAADGDALASQTVTVPPEAQTQVELSGSIDQAGTYDITVGGTSVGTLDVTEEGDGSATPAGTATPDPGEESGQSTPAADGTPTPTEAPGVFGPGFGSVVAILALLGASLLALRRRR
ncbi:MAG: hypothetical protein BRD23_00045 [Halobacteriales archaeon SW_9_67_25]|nr:MAG: hypothetical protein BRD23_00045 [Halobacteriales archaeon SW_9_67_25]